MPPDLRDWIPAGHPVHWVIESVEQLDTAGVHQKRRTGGVGRQGYDPDMLLTLLIWAWSQGQRSSRQIERLCVEDVVYRFICAGNFPDHSSIARFRKDMGDAVQGLFAQVLVLCAELGMVRLGVIALDGTKISGNASIERNRTEEALLAALEREAAKQAAKAAAEHARTDQADDDLFGSGGRGDQVPDDPGTPSGRTKRLQQALDKVRQAKKDQDQQRQQLQPTTLRSNLRTASTPELVVLAQAKVDKIIAVQQAKIDKWDADKQVGLVRPGRHRPKPVDQSARVKHAIGVRDRVVARLTAPPRKDADRNGNLFRPPMCNTTDPESGLQPKRGGGWAQGYNGQALTSGDGIIIATSVSASPIDTTTFEAMIRAGMQAAQMLAAHRPDVCNDPDVSIGLVLADAGYLSEHNLTCDGPDRLIAVGKRRQLEHDAQHAPTEGPPPDDAGPIKKMAHRLRTPEGIAAYRHRGHIAETPFGQAKHNQNFRRTTGRGLAHAKADWGFNALVHNLTKAYRHAIAT